MNVYKIDDGDEQHWFAAETAGAAVDCWINTYSGMDGMDAIEGSPLTIVVVREPNDKQMKVNSDDGSPAQTKTMREWAKDGAGMVASTVW